MKTREELIWTRMGEVPEDVIGQEFEWEGKMVKVVDYDNSGIPTITVEYSENVITKTIETMEKVPFYLMVFSVLTIMYPVIELWNQGHIAASLVTFILIPIVIYLYKSQ